jgi:hypothetical protein
VRITGPGDYRYEGADLGILMVPRKLMEDGELTARRARGSTGCAASISAYRSHGAAPPVSEPGQFKIF